MTATALRGFTVDSLLAFWLLFLEGGFFFPHVCEAARWEFPESPSHLVMQMALQTQARGLRPFSGPAPAGKASCSCHSPPRARALRRLALRSCFSRGFVSRPCVCEHFIKSVYFFSAQTRVPRGQGPWFVLASQAVCGGEWEFGVVFVP